MRWLNPIHAALSCLASQVLLIFLLILHLGYVCVGKSESIWKDIF